MPPFSIRHLDSQQPSISCSFVLAPTETPMLYLARGVSISNGHSQHSIRFREGRIHYRAACDPDTRHKSSETLELGYCHSNLGADGAYNPSSPQQGWISTPVGRYLAGLRTTVSSRRQDALAHSSPFRDVIHPPLRLPMYLELFRGVVSLTPAHTVINTSTICMPCRRQHISSIKSVRVNLSKCSASSIGGEDLLRVDCYRDARLRLCAPQRGLYPYYHQKRRFDLVSDLLRDLNGNGPFPISVVSWPWDSLSGRRIDRRLIDIEPKSEFTPFCQDRRQCPDAPSG